MHILEIISELIDPIPKPLVGILLAIILIPAVIYNSVLPSIRKRNISDRERTIQQLDMRPICPSCGNKMTKGFIHIIDTKGKTYWQDRYIEDNQKKSLSRIPNTSDGAVTTYENIAWRCQACSLVLFDYSASLEVPDNR